MEILWVIQYYFRIRKRIVFHCLVVFNIEDSKYYAVKIHNPEDFKEGLEELNIMKNYQKMLNILII